MSTEIETGPDQEGAGGDVKRPKKKARQAPQHELEWAVEKHVYEPHTVGLPPIRAYFRELWRRREFALELSRTKLRAQHFDTAFGQLWLVINPLMLALVYFILVDILRGGHRPPGFFAHLVAGIFAFYFVSGAVRDGVKSVVSGGRLVLNTSFPRALLPLSTVITAFMRFIPTFFIYIPIHIISGRPTTVYLLWVPVLIVLMALVGAGLSMFVAAGQVYFRDLKSFLPYALRIWLYASPVLYYAFEVPSRYKPLLEINPLGALLTAWSDVLNQGRAPAADDLLLGLAWGVVLFVAGALFFMSREREFAVRL